VFRQLALEPARAAAVGSTPLDDALTRRVWLGGKAPFETYDRPSFSCASCGHAANDDANAPVNILGRA
jgi:hypothetical protein